MIHSQTREVVSNVLQFMTREAEAQKFLTEPTKIIERVSEATGVSKRSIRRIKLETASLQSAEGPSTSFSTPKKGGCKKRKRPVTDLDDFDTSALRRIVHNFYLTEKCLPSVRNVLIKAKRDLNFSGSRTSLWNILRSIGFRWRNTKNQRKVLVEQHHIQHWRFKYLQEIAKYRLEGRPIVYTDETYIHSTHTVKKGWESDGKSANPRLPLSKGGRVIIVHAGGEMGFIANCLTMWKSTQNTGDYHGDMNFANYKKWLIEKLIPNLPPRSVLVIDNASYHNVQVYKVPTSNSTKLEMIAWLKKCDISFPEHMLKVELYELIKNRRDEFKRFCIDDLLEEKGHSVLRLPPYHPELNPIELVWADVKNWVARNNVSLKMSDVISLCQKKFAFMTADDWRPKCEHAKTIENEYLVQQGPLEHAVETFVIQLGGDSESSSELEVDLESDLSGIESLDSE